MNAQPRIRWGILGPGSIARKFFAAAGGSRTGVVTALGTRNASNPTLQRDFPGCVVHPTYEQLIADPAVDAIYIATPHPLHAEWAVRAARGGKHVLCEKPIGMSRDEATRMFAAAERAGTFLAEAYMYRHHPLTAFLLDLVKSGRVGEVDLIKASFGFAAENLNPGHRLVSKELGGGAILDIGGYLTSVARLLAACRSGVPVIEPDQLKAIGKFGPTGVELGASCLLHFENGVRAELSCSVDTKLDNVLHVVGSAGRLEVDEFWTGTGRTGGAVAVRLFAAGEVEELRFRENANLYSFQFEAANTAIRGGREGFDYPGMTAHDSMANAGVLDWWKSEIGENGRGRAEATK